MSVLVPDFKWAENDSKIFLTIEVPSAKGSDIKIEKDKFHFEFDQDEKKYQINFDFKKQVDPEKSTYAVHGRGIELLLAKADKGWWNQLLKDKNQYKGRCKIDWDLWHDEDEEEKPVGNFGGGPGDFDFGGAGAGDMGPDSDDDDLPDLEEAPKEAPTTAAPASTDAPAASDDKADDEDPTQTD